MKNCNSLTQRCQNTADVKREMIQLMRNINIAQTRDKDLEELLQHEITLTSLYLTKDGYRYISLKSK